MKTQISIRGRKYTVRSDEEVDLVAVAAYVDAKMTEVGGRPGAVDDYTVAMLAALNIASELVRFRQEVDAELEAVDRELGSAAALLESNLEGGFGPDDEPASEEQP